MPKAGSSGKWPLGPQHSKWDTLSPQQGPSLSYRPGAQQSLTHRCKGEAHWHSGDGNGTAKQPLRTRPQPLRTRPQQVVREERSGRNRQAPAGRPVQAAASLKVKVPPTLGTGVRSLTGKFHCVSSTGSQCTLLDCVHKMVDLHSSVEAVAPLPSQNGPQQLKGVIHTFLGDTVKVHCQDGSKIIQDLGGRSGWSHGAQKKHICSAPDAGHAPEDSGLTH